MPANPTKRIAATTFAISATSNTEIRREAKPPKKSAAPYRAEEDIASSIADIIITFVLIY